MHESISRHPSGAGQKSARLRLQTRGSLIVSANFDRAGVRRALR